MIQKNSSSMNQEDTYEVILLESKSEAERRAKLRQSATGKYLLKISFIFSLIKK